MNCIESIDRFDEYLDGLLDADEAEDLRMHLANCSSCTDELESIRGLRKSAAALPRTLGPSRDLWPGIAARIADEKVVRGRFGRRPLLAAAAAVVVLVTIIWPFKSRGRWRRISSGSSTKEKRAVPKLHIFFSCRRRHSQWMRRMTAVTPTAMPV